MQIGSKIVIMAAAAMAMGAGLMAPAVIPPPVEPPPHRKAVRRNRIKPIGYGGGYTRTTEQGNTRICERARRVRQIERGQLRAENGLVM